MTQFHGLHDTVDYQGGPEPGSESQEQHFAFSIAAQGLHGCIIHQLHARVEVGPEIKADPTTTEIAWLCNRVISQHRPWETDRNCVVPPIHDNLLDSFNHLLRRQRRSRGEFPWLRLAADQHLDVRSAHINSQNLHETLHPDKSFTTRTFLRN